MARWLPLMSILAACTAVGVAEGPVDDGSWDGAELRIASPASAAFLALEEEQTFEVILTDPDGAPLPTEGLEIEWRSDVDSEWVRAGARFDDDTLAVGLHELTAEVELPNGDRLAHTVGGVLLQSRYAGTYSGLFNTQLHWEDVPVDCSGAVLLIVDPWGEVAAGDANCLASLLGFDAPIDFVFDLDNDDGVIGGEAAIDLFGWYGLSYPATGTLDPDAGTLQVTFDSEGEANAFVDLDGSVEADRVSRDAGL